MSYAIFEWNEEEKNFVHRKLIYLSPTIVWINRLELLHIFSTSYIKEKKNRKKKEANKGK